VICRWVAKRRLDSMLLSAMLCCATALAQPTPQTAIPSFPAPTGSGQSTIITRYADDDAQLFRRGLVKTVTSGELKTTYEYPDDLTIVMTDPDGIKTTTELDELGRVIHVTTGGASLHPEEWFAYDGRGLRVRSAFRQGAKVVERRYTYDIVGRLVMSELYDVAAPGANGTLVEKTTTTYDLPSRTISTTLPTGGKVTTLLDREGRTVQTLSDPSTSTVADHGTITTQRYAYDIAGNLVFSSDDHFATATQYDVAHRAKKVVRSDGTSSTMTIDGLGRVTETKEEQSAQHTSASYTPEGKPITMTVNDQVTSFAWDRAGRINATHTIASGVDVARGSTVSIDDSGRLVDARSGTSVALGSIVFSNSHRHNDFPVGKTFASKVETSEKNDAFTDKWTLTPDALGNVKTAQNDAVPALKYDTTRDEVGNVIAEQTPARRGVMSYEYEARGLMTAEIQPEAGTIHHTYDALGGETEYRDQSEQKITTLRDGFGRVVKRTYESDGTYEELWYTGSRLQKKRDRNGRFQQYAFDAKDRLVRITQDGTDATTLESFSYDGAGRMTSWRSHDVELAFGSFDTADRPRTITQRRYATDHNTLLDTFTIGHEWNGFGEVTKTIMPATDATGNWTQSMSMAYDSAGNLTKIDRALLSGTNTLLTSDYRAAGRPMTRTIMLTGGQTLERKYGYDDEVSAGAGQLNEMSARIGTTLVAGSHISFEGLQIKSAQHLGISNGARYSSYQYDDRGRLKGEVIASTKQNEPAPPVPGAVIQHLGVSDFLSALLRTPTAGASTMASSTFTEGAAHKVAAIVNGNSTTPLQYAGSTPTTAGDSRTGDDRFTYTYDEQHRVIEAREKQISASFVRRVRYDYSGTNRITGRTLEAAPIVNGVVDENGWQLAQPGQIADQVLPAATTMVWDPITDQLLAVYDATTHKLLRQYIHGGMGLDDPIEVAVADASSADTVTRLYPLFDEAGSGTLQAVIGENGYLVARNVMPDPYGAEEVTIPAPLVDQVQLTATTNAGGTLDTMDVSIRLTEPMAAATIASGAKLSTLAAAGKPAHSFATTPTQISGNAYALHWTLTATTAPPSTPMERTARKQPRSQSE
jgi:YD repeat-containing protein